MKTTIEISDALFRKARALADRDHTTFRALVERGLRGVLAESREERPFKLRDASVMGEGLQPEFQGASWEKFRETIYEGRGG